MEEKIMYHVLCYYKNGEWHEYPKQQLTERVMLQEQVIKQLREEIENLKNLKAGSYAKSHA